LLQWPWLLTIYAEDKAIADCAAARFRECDAAITAELVRRSAPAKLPGVTLHLTPDRLNFVALKPGTRKPLIGYAPLSPSALLDYSTSRRKPTAKAAG
jgi:hypothetical protein